MSAILPWLMAHWAVLALILSEALPLIPGIQSNSIGQLLIAGLRSVLAKAPPAPPLA
jgi:hypothetical protein